MNGHKSSAFKAVAKVIGMVALIVICVWSFLVVMIYVPEAQPYWNHGEYRSKWSAGGGEFSGQMNRSDEYSFSSALDKTYLIKVNLYSKGHGFDRDFSVIESAELPLMAELYEGGALVIPDLFSNKTTVSTTVTKDEIIRGARFPGKANVDYAVRFVYEDKRDGMLIPEGSRIYYTLDESISDFAYYSAMTVYVCAGIFVISLLSLIWIYKKR